MHVVLTCWNDTILSLRPSNICRLLEYCHLGMNVLAGVLPCRHERIANLLAEVLPSRHELVGWSIAM
jgi:hypothetical protein